MTNAPVQSVSCGGEELRIVRLDGSLTPYSKDDFLEYYGPDGWRIWQNAVPYKDAAGNRLHVLVRIGERSLWGCVGRISQESVVLESMLEGCDDDAFLDLSAIVGCDLCYNICARILDYLCGYDSDWWEQSPSMGALDVADKLGLERLLSSIVRPPRKEEWERCSIGHCTPAGLDTIPAQPISGAGDELRIERSDGSLTPYSKGDFLENYGPDGCRLWQNAVPYKDAAGNRLHVLVRIGQCMRWGCVVRILQESAVLKSLLEGCDDDAFLDLRAIVGCDLCDNICVRILDYLCGYDSDWWEQSPSMGALDVADKLGLERLLSSIVRPLRQDKWQRTRNQIKHPQCVSAISHN